MFEFSKINVEYPIYYYSFNNLDANSRVSELYNLEVKTINNFNDIESIKQGALEKVDAKKKKDTILFIFVGRLEDASKKMRRALNVIKETKKTELWVIGDGPDRQLYEDYVKKNKLLEEAKTFLDIIKRENWSCLGGFKNAE